MSYYYKANEQKSFEILRLEHKIKKHNKLVLEWLESKFNIPEDASYYPFVNEPEFTESILEHNPHLRSMKNKTNNRLSKRNAEAKELIRDWKNFKKENNFVVKGLPPKIDYSMALRNIFPYGSIHPLFDKENKVVYFKTSEQSTHEALEEITMKEYNLKEIELDESEDK